MLYLKAYFFNNTSIFTTGQLTVLLRLSSSNYNFTALKYQSCCFWITQSHYYGCKPVRIILCISAFPSYFSQIQLTAQIAGSYDVLNNWNRLLWDACYLSSSHYYLQNVVIQYRRSQKFIFFYFKLKLKMSSQSSSLCNLMLQPSDLKKLEDLDPFQIDGFKTLGKVAVPVTIKYCDELQNQISDKQILGFQVLANHVRNHFKDKQPTSLEHVRIYITSEQDLYLNFVCNFNLSTFEGMKNKTGINLIFNDFPNALLNLLTNCNNENIQGGNQAELKLSYQGTGKLYITQQTEYKKLQLIELSFVASNVEKVQQSIIYRFNYETTRLAMLQKSIKSIYALLEKKNEPLLQYIQKNVGINE